MCNQQHRVHPLPPPLPNCCSRIVMVGARDRLLPPQLSRVSKRTQTPALAQLLVGGIICEAGEEGLGWGITVFPIGCACWVLHQELLCLAVPAPMQPSSRC